jgi:hypothetical protein
VRGNSATETIIPATSSMTIKPGSFRSRTASTRLEAQVPTTRTAARADQKPNTENGMSQSPSAATRLPAVPGATGK